MKFDLRNKFIFALAGVFIAILIINTFSIICIYSLKSSTDWVIHTKDVILKMERILSFIKDA